MPTNKSHRALISVPPDRNPAEVLATLRLDTDGRFVDCCNGPNPFVPDRKCEGGVPLAMKVTRATLALEAWCNWHGDQESDEADLRDLLTDLMHYCDASKLDFDDQLRIALSHYHAEKAR